LLLCTALFQRGVTWLGFKNGKIEDITQGKASLLVKDGVMQLDEMEKVRISRQQLFSQLRQENIFNLGNVERVYFEACGIFSIFQSKEQKPGLAIYPPDDKEIMGEMKPATAKESGAIQLFVCVNCGYVKQGKNEGQCEDCGHQDWINAIN
jgi:uncharacterized membrane protein YcaP (DUF421 family)